MRLRAARLNSTIKQSAFSFPSVKHFDPIFEVLKINMPFFNRSVPFLSLLLCGLLASTQASAEIKLGVVNFQKLLEEAPQTKTAMQALENEFAPRRRELLTMQNDLKAKDEKLQKEGAVMSEADRAKAE